LPIGDTLAGDEATLTLVIDGGGDVITTGVKAGLDDIPFKCQVISWTLTADQVCSIVIDLWDDTYANFPPTVADTMTGSAKPTLSNARKAQSSVLTGWSTTLNSGDSILPNVESVSSATRITLTLRVRKIV
jgi:hypothetical protein